MSLDYAVKLKQNYINKNIPEHCKIKLTAFSLKTVENFQEITDNLKGTKQHTLNYLKPTKLT